MNDSRTFLAAAGSLFTKFWQKSNVVADDRGLQILNGAGQSTFLPWSHIAEITDDPHQGSITLWDLSGASHHIPSALDNFEELLRLVGERAAVNQQPVQLPTCFRRKALRRVMWALSVVPIGALAAFWLSSANDRLLLLLFSILVGQVIFSLIFFLFLSGQRRLLIEATRFTFHKGFAKTTVPFSSVGALRVGYRPGRGSQSGPLYVIVTLTNGSMYALRVFGNPVFDIYRALRASWQNANGRTI